MVAVGMVNPGYRVATVGLRVRRVALLFPAVDASWRQWARLALRQCTRVWGGGGFVLVPYDESGVIHPDVVAAVKAYDPDDVTLLVGSPKTWATTSPRFTPRLYDHDATGIPYEEWASVERFPVNDGIGRRAVDALLRACSVMTPGGSPDWESGRGRQWQVQDGFAPADGGLPDFLAAEFTWGSDAALFAGAVAGIVDTEPAHPQPDEEALVSWCLDPTFHAAPHELVYESTAGSGSGGRKPLTRFEAAAPDLRAYRRGVALDERPLIIIGDTAADFALAVVTHRIRSRSVWLTATVLATPFPVPQVLKATMAHLVDFSPSLTSHVYSTSLSQTRVVELLRNADPSGVQVWDENGPVDTRISGRFEWGLPALDDAPLTLMLSEHLGTEITVPVYESPGGTFELATPLDTPIPSRPRVSNITAPGWVVDVEFGSAAMPGGRGLRPSALLAASNSQPVNIRSSRGGVVSFDAASQGFVSPAMILSGRLARPVLRVPGLEEWIRAMAQAGGYTSRLSGAGRKTALIASRVGGRKRLTEIVSGPLYGFLREFVATSEWRETTTDAFSSEDGVVLTGNVRMLTYRALQRLSSSLPSEERRDHLDELLRAGVLRRGLLLDCADCAEPFFLAVEDLAQSYTCPRCGAKNQLTADRWKRSTDEPEWYYDLHAAFRSLLKAHGDAVLLTAAHLRAGSRSYSDASELEFIPSGASRPDYEIDLIAHTAEGVLVCEVKSNANLGSGKTRDAAIEKRFAAARLVRADRVVFASVGKPWEEKTSHAVTACQQRAYPDVGVEMLFVPVPN